MTYDHLKLCAELRRDEGERRFPYVDTVGKLTIGVGWNLTDNGLPVEIIDRLLSISIHEAARVVTNVHPRWHDHPDTVQRVLLNMAFNLGYRLKKFKRFLRALDLRDYRLAAEEMLRSKWAEQVGARAKRLARMMEES